MSVQKRRTGNRREVVVVLCYVVVMILIYHVLLLGWIVLSCFVLSSGDQGNASAVEQWVVESGGDFDFVIDDGGHFNNQILTTFDILWNKALKKGGIYFIEDLQVLRARTTKEERKRGIPKVFIIYNSTTIVVTVTITVSLSVESCRCKCNGIQCKQ